MKKYEILEHRADLKIRAFGRNKGELFSDALFGMSESMEPEIKKPEENVTREIEIKAVDLPALLVDFLGEALYLSQTKREVYSSAKFEKFSGAEIKGKLLGRKVESFGVEIKAATHHSLEIKQDKNNWEATILFDI